MNRVVVTGLGAVTPLGLDVTTFWQRLCAGERGLVRIGRFDPVGLRNEKGGEIGEWAFNPADYGLQREPDLAVQFLLRAASEAWGDAKLAARLPEGPAVGAVLSTNFGGGLAWEEFCREGAPEAFEDFVFDTALECLARSLGLTGPMSLLSIACASGAASIGYAFDLIRAGKAEVMLAGGHDVLSPSPLSGLSVLHTLTAEDIRPFSADRSGTMFGEGAAVLALESLESAQGRGAKVYAEVLGSWQNNNAYHLTAPDKGGAGMARVLGGALADAQLAPEKLDHINAHGTGTRPHDVAETEAIKRVLGSHAYEIPVCSIKGAIAHLMGAAGAVEAVSCVKAIATGIVPPTMNYRERDPECDLDYVPNEAREVVVRYAATISAGVGGSNACVVFGPAPEAAVQRPKALLPVTCAVPGPYALAHEVVVTGLAPITAIGIGREDFVQGLAERREGRRPPERLTDHRLPLLAECLDFVVEDYLESAKTYLDRCSELTLAACALAWADAGLDWRELDHQRVGLCLGTAFGCLDSMENMTGRVQSKGVRFGSPVIFTHSFANTPTSLAAVEYDLQGPTSTFCVGALSAASALDYAWRIIADGRAEVVLAGGVEALSAALLRYLGQVQPDYVPGEGACLLVLESAEHAARRGAQVLAQVSDVTLRKSETAPPAESPSWGHTFGASLALEAAARLLTEGSREIVVTGPGGPDAGDAQRGASISLRRLT